MKHLVIVFALSAFTFGCGSSEKLNYTNVSGTVNYNGKPLDQGTVTFSIAGTPPTLAQIVDGKFSGQAVIGKNTVSISSMRKSDKASSLPPIAAAQMEAYAKAGKGGSGSADLTANMQDIIPDNWGSKSKEVRVIEAGAQNTFDFDIKGK